MTQPDVAREEVAKAAHADVAQLAAAGDRGVAVETMAQGATAVVLDLFAKGTIHFSLFRSKERCYSSLI